MNDPYRHMDGYDPPPADGPPAPYEYEEDPVSVEHRQHPERYDYDDLDAQADAFLATVPGDDVDDMPLDWPPPGDPIVAASESLGLWHPGPGEPDAGHDDEPPRYEEDELDNIGDHDEEGFDPYAGAYDVDVADGFQTLGDDFDG